jgi:diadenosine tetraphosphate (Ap4A) HIT family hydrolase
MMERTPFDLKAYAQRTRSGGCFICEFLRGNPSYAHHVIREDEETVVFLNKYPTLVGYCLVAPKAHLEDLTDDLDEAQYVRLQRTVYKLARALKRALPVERVYVLSLGSRQGNSHLHWHVAPLPQGVPYEQQQYHALMAENGVLNLSESAMRDLAQTIRAAFAAEG